MRKILYVSGTGDISGGQNSLWVLLKSLDRQLYQPSVVCPFTGHFTDRARRAGLPVHILSVRAPRASLNPLHLLRNGQETLSFVRQLQALIRRERIDLIHATSHSLGVSCSLAARSLRVPVIWHVRDIPASPIKRWVIAQAASKLATHVIAVSESVARVYTPDRQDNARVSVIYNAVELPDPSGGRRLAAQRLREEFGADENAHLVGNIGRLIPWKGQDRLLRAAARLVKDWPDTKFLIVGDMITSVRRYPSSYLEYKPKLLALCEELGLGEHIVFTGFRKDVMDIYAALDIYVHTAVEPDPLPRVVLEAMSSGVPVIASDLGGVPEMIEHGISGLLYPPGDVGALTAQIQSLLADEAQCQRLAQNALMTIRQRFTVDRHVAAIRSVYESVLG
jgi:glycosyltransferase involved in cell wall biosynthesis